MKKKDSKSEPKNHSKNEPENESVQNEITVNEVEETFAVEYECFQKSKQHEEKIRR